ncbi:MAG: cytochrome c [Nitrospira sp.]
MKYGMIALALFATTIFSVNFARSEAGVEKDVGTARVPEDEMDEAREWTNPFKSTPENIAKGKALFVGKATCFTCHGNEGKGDGIAGAALDPGPRNFHNPLMKNRQAGEYMWVVANGVEGTGMISYTPGIVSEEEAALIILFEMSLRK